ncbi:acyl-CoA dehydrogenase family protein [Amycolatopsis rhabdoformis]|uniref:Acyl-CoA dehydrogenase family protein n=1 Tax=Amycolatopsis rhabdoformis TaxID=1448059 RepID=A0ABZ1HXB5_9PSEU|nr:acyl-CoA dehydrogenase family protein [Amycolatopsis rhabdoformis]WSE26192.1 acyl-CoA dehydrogenase family protein [Amycolatopsis rhabdoformis]
MTAHQRSPGVREPATSVDELVARARALVPMLSSRAEQTERDRRVSPETIDALREAELFKLMQPRRFGGFELGFDALVDIDLELAQGCGSSAWCASLGMVHQWFTALFPLPAQEEVWADPGTIVAGSYMPAGRAEAAPGGFEVSGRWSFTSNCDNSGFFLLGTMFPADGAAPRAGFSLVPRADLTIIDDWHTVGLAGTGSKSVAIEEPVFVPEHRHVLVENLATGTAPGFAVSGNPVHTLPLLSVLPACLVSPALGMVDGAVRDFLDWIGERKTTGAVSGGGASMAQFAHVQSRIAEATASLDAAKLLLRRDLADAAFLVSAGEEMSLATRFRNRRDHGFAVQLAVRAASGLFDAVGGRGLHMSSSIQRAWRDVNAVARHASLNWDAISTMYGQHRFGLEPRGQF